MKSFYTLDSMCISMMEVVAVECDICKRFAYMHIQYMEQEAIGTLCMNCYNELLEKGELRDPEIDLDDFEE